MMRRVIAVILTAAALLFAFTGCGAGASKTANESKADMAAPQAVSAVSGRSYDSADRSAGKLTDTGEAANTEAPDIKKVIKNGEIAVEVKDVEAAYQDIGKILLELGGEEFNKDFNISSGHKRMSLVLKIPPEKLNEFQQRLTGLVGSGKIKSSSIRSQDITSEYYDIAARLESYETSRDQLRELLKRAANVDEMLKIHSELTRLQADIDSLHGQIKMWDKLVDMATITLYIDEESDPLRRTATVGWELNSAGDIWRTMKNGFVGVVNTLYNVLVWALIVIVSISPLLAIAAIILFIVLYMRRKKKKRNSSTPPLA